jgi:hypothetical protein
MYTHIIMWKFKDQDQDGNSREQIARKVKTLLEGLKDQIDVIRHIEAGIDVSRTPSSFDVVLYSEFDSREDFQTYLDHPAHKKAGAYIVSTLTERALADYES